jgi:hypothetical protein
VNTYLPTVHGNPEVIQGQSDNAQLFIDAWMAALGDRASIMRQDSRLTSCAQRHATYLAQRQGEDMQKSMHLGEGGSTANQRVQASGYKIPSFWSLENNNCEACAVHHDGPIEALALLIGSPAHRPLVLGERVSDWFWHHHTVFGIGVTSPFYVLICCVPEGSM